jgi:hypothetical protein
VTSIEHRAFHDCDSLVEVVIPAGVTLIDTQAFTNNGSLTSIIFKGTMEAWNNITKGSDWNTRVPAIYVQCSDGQVAL